jgi:hypothetical protein
VQQAAELPEAFFRLETHCPDQQIIRELQLLPSGVAIWNRRTQLRISPAMRSELLGDLLRGGFFALEARYGGRDDPGRPGAAVRITCRVTLELEGSARSSVQLAEGRQSTELASLANVLLDRVQPLVASGITPDNLTDGLDQLAAGKLAPELLRLRWVLLPGTPGNGPGTISRIHESVFSRRRYTPGREIGDTSERALEAEQIQALAQRLDRVGFESLPINLWSDDPIEIEVGVLGHRKTVLARPFGDLESQRDEQAQARLEQLLGDLRALESTLRETASSHPSASWHPAIAAIPRTPGRSARHSAASHSAPTTWP